MSKRLVVFNHKGGVSKTTSVYNIGWMLAKKNRVMIVDADPQCNLSSLVLGDDFEKYYIDENTRLNNIKDGVQVAFTGKPMPIEAITCYSPPRAKGLFLLAGHANLSEYDAALTFAQTSNNALTTLQNLPGAFQRLIELTEAKYNIDYTIIDLNPSLSAINQNLFLNSDAFLIPTNPDPFSLMAIKTLQSTLPRWISWKKNAVELFSESAYPIRQGVPKFCGTLIQRFNVRNGKSAKPYRDNIDEIKSLISEEFFKNMQELEMTYSSEIYTQSIIDSHFCLAEIPDFQGLLPKAQNIGVPVFDITDDEIGETGPVLAGMRAKRQNFTEQFEKIATDLTSMLNHA